MTMRANMKTMLKLTVAILFILLTSLIAYSVTACLQEFNFDNDKALHKWHTMILNGEVKYSLVKQADNGFVEAQSDKTCSALYYRIGYKLKDYPMLSWKWKVLKFPDKSAALSEQEKDDYAARVYVIFPFLSFSSSKFIEYIWSEDLPKESIMNSPDADNVKLVVIRTGEKEAGEWISESRNVYEDYIKAFGQEPKRGVGAIAMMCDADNTKSQAESLFDNITIESLEGFKRRVEENDQETQISRK